MHIMIIIRGQLTDDTVSVGFNGILLVKSPTLIDSVRHVATH